MENLVGAFIFICIILAVPILIFFDSVLHKKIALKKAEKNILKYFDLLDENEQEKIRQLSSEGRTTYYYFDEIRKYESQIKDRLSSAKTSSFNAQINEKIKVNQRVKELKKELNHD